MIMEVIMPEQIENVGFIGLGRMGVAMSKNILKAGFRVTVYNRTREKLLPLIENGAIEATSPGMAAAGADVVISCLMDDKSMYEIMDGPDGILAGMKPGAIHIGTATISPGCALRLAEMHKAHGSIYIAGPIVGRPDAAAAGKLVTYLAGDPQAIIHCEPLFKAYTQRSVNVGSDHRAANNVKLAINFMLATQIEMMSEAFAFAERSGIDQQLISELIETVTGHPALKDYARRIRSRDFEPAAFEITAGFKDMDFVVQASTEARVPMAFANVLRDRFLIAIANDMGAKDWSAISEVARLTAGLK
jgi:3-hydroxyisobutyrate dehydrogenase-like beta-hydroxyacid dehydrogenase